MNFSSPLTVPYNRRSFYIWNSQRLHKQIVWVPCGLISISNSMICSNVCHKNHERYFEIVRQYAK